MPARAGEPTPATGGASSGDAPYAVGLRGITRRFPGVVANRDIELRVGRGATVGTADPGTTTVRQLAEMMVGSELPSPETRTSTVRDVPVLTVRDVVAVLVAALWAGLVAVAALVGFLTIDVLPPGIVSFTPHLTALLVLSLASQRLRMPQADGLDYRRGEG